LSDDIRSELTVQVTKINKTIYVENQVDERCIEQEGISSAARFVVRKSVQFRAHRFPTIKKMLSICV